MESDISQGTSTRSELTGRLCMQDAELNGMLLKLSRGRDQGIRRGNRPNGRQASRRQVPIAVTQAAPHLNGKQLCLRYISIKGCPSNAPDRCTYEFLGHFNPETLDPIVREYVVEKYGGLSSEMSDRV
ncbi:12-oxophytodienoate reductase [Phytophthora palmivora]|uniref:12-oxophytodienoate reductase n=1 Tax=Phytophthora palmivora TaxID=4796 RepID=A0A2P4XVU2_9STRA|nr:12-oxophytodienoate reductase [Phytophthora palmivora]